MTEWIVDGRRGKRLSVNSRGLHYGDGLFETIAIRDAKPRLWNLHMDRLRRGCRRLQLATPDEDECLAGILEALGGRRCAVAKLIVAARGGERGYARQSDAITVAIAAFDCRPVAKSLYRQGVRTTLCRTRLAAGSPTAGLKTLNRLEQVLARLEVDSSCFEGIMLDADAQPICGTMSNLFGVRAGRIFTPSLDRCGVEGVMRRHVLNVLGQTCDEVSIRPIGHLQDMDEVFISNSQFGVLPVRSCGEFIWPVGTTTLMLMRALADAGIEECAR